MAGFRNLVDHLAPVEDGLVAPLVSVDRTDEAQLFARTIWNFAYGNSASGQLLYHRMKTCATNQLERCGLS